MNRARASFASIASPAGTGASTTSRYQSASIESGIRIVRPNCSSGAAVSGMLLPDRRAHLGPVPGEQERRRQDDLRLEPVRLHHGPAGEQVVELVGAAELDIGLDGDRVVRLHERIEELGDGDRVAGGNPLREVVALEELRDRDVRVSWTTSANVRLGEPLAVVPHLRPLRIEDQQRLVEVDAVRWRRSPRRTGSGARPSGRTGSPIRVV